MLIERIIRVDVEIPPVVKAVYKGMK